MDRPTVDEVWRALPARPGMVPPVVALRFPGISVPTVLLVLEAMVSAGHAIRTTRRGHDVYHRGTAPTPADTRNEEAPLWT